MNKEKLTELYHKYELSKDDFFKHQHYTIITRQGIDKIQAREQIQIDCQSWYVAEMAEKRAMSRAVLKLTGFYELGVMGQDESDSFKKPEKIKLTKEEIINKNK